MGQMKRLKEHQEHVTAVAEEILVEVGYFERCEHHTLVSSEPSAKLRNIAMGKATNWAKANTDYSQEEVTAAVADVIRDNAGGCGLCAKRYRDD